MHLESAADRATLAGTAIVLDARLSVREKVPLAWEIRNVLVKTPDGQVPDLDSAFTKRDAAGKPDVAQVQTDLNAAIRDTLTRGFRSSFMIAAGLGALALVPGLLALRRATAAHDAQAARCDGARRARRRLGRLDRDGGRRGCVGLRAPELVDPCTAPLSPYDGSGLDGAVQRIALGGLNGAACDLGVGREELVLSLDPDSGVGSSTGTTTRSTTRSGRARCARSTMPTIAAPSPVGQRPRSTWSKHAPISWFLDNVPIDKIPFLN